MSEGSTQNISYLRLMDYHQRNLAFEKTGPAERQAETNWSGVTFRTGDFRLICSIEDIVEILDILPLTPIPLSKPWLLGLANVRGNLVSVCDYYWFLSGVRSPITARSRLLLTDISGYPVALLVDEILGQRHLNTKDVRNSKEYQDTPLAACVSREYRTGDDRWGELDLRALFSDPKFMTGSDR